jgi:serralysin
MSSDASSPGPDAFPVAPQSFLDADARAGVVAENGKLSYSIDQAATQLLRDDDTWSSMGQAFTVTYAYRASAPTTMPSDTGGFQQFNAAQINETELAIKAWEDVANIHFVRIGSGTAGFAAYSNSAAILFGDYTTGETGSAAFTYFPGSTAASSSAGDVWVNGTLSYNLNPTVGNYGGMTLVHEIGHAIGLEHPSDYDASTNSTLTYGADASYYEDDRQYTVMSYFSESNTGANFGGAYAASPLLDDIAAAQKAYGANMATRLGDTVYGFNANADEPWFIASSSASKLVFAVWDAGGTDTLDFSGYSNNQLIDLRPGNFSNVGGLTGNVAIAQNVTIEDAVGGSGADVIYGN